MTIHKVAYSAFVAFLASLLTLLSINALSSDEARDVADGERRITLDELAEHDTAEHCWKAIHGKVYDITDYVPDHPTPEAVILAWCGREATEAWENKRPGVPHSPGAEARLAPYLIGTLVDADGDEFATEAAVASAGEAPATADAEPLSPAADERLHRALLGLPLDGHYRGVFIDRGVIQVNITFDLRDGHFTRLEYRHLAYRNQDYQVLEEGDDLYPVLVQYRQILERLEGQPVSAIFALHEPERVVDDVDGFTGATLRGAKVISAIRDALNRGVYAWP
ncbi:cytochrome b5 domain-containing protein [Halomonas sp. C05BenzN]|uniref:cytochrome b5 domain-containing protein n=1 Tax=Halomonas sp. C05BenzN TaxID=3411041 RepID=UPI003B961E9D